jgi:AcrR family transcriptional regulator
VPAARQEEHRQDGVLAGTHEGEPGLPRGRSGLPAEEVRAAQRERLLRSVVAAVARRGFADTTVADIVRGARVSKAAFYAHFTDKEDCFLSATGQGRRMMIDRVIGAARALPATASAEDILRAGLRAYLEFLVQESAFSRAFYVDMLAVGPRAAERIEQAQHSFARMNRAWHEHGRQHHPDWPTVPYQAYYALAGATTELVRAEVRQGRTETMASLEETLVCLHMAVLAGRPWPAPGRAPA